MQKNMDFTPRLNVDWEHFNEDIPIEEVADILGIEMKQGNAFLCPAHNDVKNPSAKIRHKTNTWCCFTCGAGGTALNLVQAVRGGSIFEAAQFLEQFYPGGIKVIEAKRKEKYPEIPEALLRIIGLKRNPFIKQSVRIPISITPTDNTKMRYVKKPVKEREEITEYSIQEFYIDPAQAAELVLEHCMKYYEKHIAMSNQIKKMYPDLDKNALWYIEQKNRSDLLPISVLAEDMRDIIAKEDEKEFPWDEIEQPKQDKQEIEKEEMIR